jgi:hypothetical protein
VTPAQTLFSSSSMLTSSPACSARYNSSRSDRASSRAVSPSLEIWSELELTVQSPMRTSVVLGVSCGIGEHLLWIERKQNDYIDYMQTPSCVRIKAQVRTAGDFALYKASLWATFQKNSEHFRANSGLSVVELATVGQRRPCIGSGRQFLMQAERVSNARGF